jgi:hypothetical protein
MATHWRIFNFLVRRVVALAFAVGGTVIAVVNIGAVLPGGTFAVNGVASADLVIRWSAVLLPLIVAALGVALYRVAPITPSSSNG